MFAYKAAVAVKKLGFGQVKIYNGGLKDWKKSGFKTEAVEPLPDYTCQFIDSASLVEKLDGEAPGCTDEKGQPKVTLVDFRTEPFLNTEKAIPYIKTTCPVIHCLLDDLKTSGVRDKIPTSGLVVVVSETGNRDWAAIRYLSLHGYTNILGLKYGMRDWLKSGYPVEYLMGKPVQ